MKKLIVTSSNELICVATEYIVFAQADGNYTEMTLVDRSTHTFSFNLQHFAQLLASLPAADAAKFIRVGKSLIVNQDYILLLRPLRQQLVLTTGMMRERFELSASKEALKQLKQSIVHGRMKGNTEHSLFLEPL